jgi:tRNA (guanine-N7-)-methyltransferase
VGRVRQHVNPLKSDLLEIAAVPRIAPLAGRALEVELGAAEAHFLIDRARADRETLFVGVEIRRELVASTNAICVEAGMHNVRCVFANMSVDMPRLFAPESVQRFFLNFPDPWFKSRQHKRRVIGPALIAEIGRALAPAGELYVMTDIFTLALEKSRRERQCEQEGARVWRLLYRRVA